MTECDFILSFTSYDFEPVSVDALKAWIYEVWKNEVYVIGPLLPSDPTSYGFASDNSNMSSEIQTFLAKSLKDHGEKLVVLVSTITRVYDCNLSDYKLDLFRNGILTDRVHIPRRSH